MTNEAASYSLAVAAESEEETTMTNKTMELN